MITTEERAYELINDLNAKLKALDDAELQLARAVRDMTNLLKAAKKDIYGGRWTARKTGFNTAADFLKYLPNKVDMGIMNCRAHIDAEANSLLRKFEN